MKRYFVAIISKLIPIESSRKYRGKLLLFGEYTIIDGGPGLAIPLAEWSGKAVAGAGDPRLMPFFDHLSSLDFLEASKIDSARESGWCFDSNIPVGSGLGSSGALCAAAYDAFKKKQNGRDDLHDIKMKLAAIESFFHGTSSGIDPLVSWLDMPVLIRGKNILPIEEFVLPSGIFLWDSGLPRETSAFVSIYKEKKDIDPAFSKACSELDALNAAIVKECQHGRLSRSLIEQLSQLQWQHFSEFIPESLSALWHEGLKNKTHFFKLAGAGGGGMFLVFIFDSDPESVDFGPLIMLRMSG